MAETDPGHAAAAARDLNPLSHCRAAAPKNTTYHQPVTGCSNYNNQLADSDFAATRRPYN